MKGTLAALLLAVIASAALAQDKGRPGVSFVEPRDGATVGQEFKVVMGVSGMSIKPAGDMTENTGHHHLLVDADPIKKGDVIPVDASHLHFGKGQTETTLKLPPGRHKLQLQFADGAHRSYGEAMSATIFVTVK
jgi:hypothetical protein